MLNFKYYIRKNKTLSLLLKPLYRRISEIRNIPIQKKAYENTVTIVNSIDAKEKKIWYFGVPTHANLGDQAQKYCIIKWVEKNYEGWKIIRITSNAFNYKNNLLLDAISNKVSPEDIMIMQSGYTFDGLHPDEQSHRVISESFPNNKIVFFPQTILYKAKKYEIQMCKAINQHKKTLLLARDRISYESAVSYYPNVNVVLFPDIVTTLIGIKHFEKKREGILFCIRNDGEKLYSDAMIANLADRVKKFGHVDITDTSSMDYASISDDNILRDNILSTVSKYSEYRAIITDRYHGTIFSLVAGTPVIVLKTTDHKVITGAEWFSGVYDDYVYRAQSIEEAENILAGLINKELDYKLKPYFKEKYYDGLKNMINGID